MGAGQGKGRAHAITLVVRGRPRRSNMRRGWAGGGGACHLLRERILEGRGWEGCSAHGPSVRGFQVSVCCWVVGCRHLRGGGAGRKVRHVPAALCHRECGWEELGGARCPRAGGRGDARGHGCGRFGVKKRQEGWRRRGHNWQLQPWQREAQRCDRRELRSRRHGLLRQQARDLGAGRAAGSTDD